MMFEQVTDFVDESDALYELLAPLADDDYRQQTLFKQWTFNDVIGHLHVWNQAADMALTDPAAFGEFFARVRAAMMAGDMRAFETGRLEGLSGRRLHEAWRAFYTEMAGRFSQADPKARVKWAGPDMSVRSSITARLMETWAHGQAIYDALGVDRVDSDRIRNIATLGVNTFGWTFRNRGLAVPAEPPHVRLTAPSGVVWTWNPPQADNCIDGDATEFCQVVTQVRNVADTQLDLTGDTAGRWMAIAQCFAGPPEDPPAPGVRHRA